MSRDHVYPGTEVLVNKLDIRDQEQLNYQERMRTSVRMAELIDNPIKGNYDLEHLSKIHKHLFQDLYSWAGEVRSVDIAKGSTPFCKAMFIQDNAAQIFSELKNANHLKGLDHANFTERLSYFKSEINIIHPFREGNGRTTREFIRTVGLNAGYNLEFKQVPREELLKAMVRSVYNTKDLERVLKHCVTNKTPDSRFEQMLHKDRDVYFRGFER